MRAHPSCFSCLALLAMFLAAPGTARGVQFIDVSPSGAQFPEWDGGDTGLCFADIDQDGHLDFLSIGDHGSPYVGTSQHGIMVYFGDGVGGWSIHMEGNFGYGGIAVGDVNGDGHLDVGYGMHHDYSGNDFGDQLIEVALGDGSGQSWTPWDDGLATSGEDWGMFATDFADIDHDGDLDLASNSFGCCNGVHVYRNEGDGTWTQTWALSGGNASGHLCFGDVNADGHPDLAASFQYGTVFLGDGTGGFTGADDGLPATGGYGFSSVCLGDVNQDGCDDLAFTFLGGVYVYVWAADHWENASAGLTGGDHEVVRLADLDANGFMDVITHGDGAISCWLGEGSGQWTAAGTQQVGQAIDTAAFECGGDIDHNGRPDVVLVQEEGSWPSYQNELYVFIESTTSTERFVRVTAPGPAARLLGGSVHTAAWLAAQLGSEPATVDVELSVSGPSGPWMALAQNRPDSGRHQWIVPQASSEQAYLRVTLHQGGESVSGVGGPFTIEPTGTASVPDETERAHGWQRMSLRVHPNPAATHLVLSWRDEAGSESPLSGADLSGGWVTLFGADGRCFASLSVGAGGSVDLSASPITRSLPDGIYWLQYRAAGQHRTEGQSRTADVTARSERFLLLR